MSDDLELDLPLTASQASAGHEVAITVSRRANVDGQWCLKDEVVRVRPPAGVAPRTVLRLPGMGHARADGSTGDMRIRLMIDEPEYTAELRISPADAACGVSRTVQTATGGVVVDLPAGTADGLLIKRGNLVLKIEVDPLLSNAPVRVPKRRLDSGRRWALGGGLLLSVYGFIWAFALPFSDLGKPEVTIDGRFFVLGFGGLATALFALLPVRADSGRGKSLALIAAFVVLAAIVAANFGLISLLERHGYFLRF